MDIFINERRFDNRLMKNEQNKKQIKSLPQTGPSLPTFGTYFSRPVLSIGKLVLHYEKADIFLQTFLEQ